MFADIMGSSAWSSSDLNGQITSVEAAREYTDWDEARLNVLRLAIIEKNIYWADGQMGIYGETKNVVSPYLFLSIDLDSWQMENDEFMGWANVSIGKVDSDEQEDYWTVHYNSSKIAFMFQDVLMGYTEGYSSNPWGLDDEFYGCNVIPEIEGYSTRGVFFQVHTKLHELGHLLGRGHCSLHREENAECSGTYIRMIMFGHYLNAYPYDGYYLCKLHYDHWVPQQDILNAFPESGLKTSFTIENQLWSPPLRFKAVKYAEPFRE